MKNSARLIGTVLFLSFHLSTNVQGQCTSQSDGSAARAYDVVVVRPMSRLERLTLGSGVGVELLKAAKGAQGIKYEFHQAVDPLDGRQRIFWVLRDYGSGSMFRAYRDVRGNSYLWVAEADRAPDRVSWNEIMIKDLLIPSNPDAARATLRNIAKAEMPDRFKRRDGHMRASLLEVLDGIPVTRMRRKSGGQRIYRRIRDEAEKFRGFTMEGNFGPRNSEGEFATESVDFIFFDGVILALSRPSIRPAEFSDRVKYLDVTHEFVQYGDREPATGLLESVAHRIVTKGLSDPRSYWDNRHGQLLPDYYMKRMGTPSPAWAQGLPLMASPSQAERLSFRTGPVLDWLNLAAQERSLFELPMVEVEGLTGVRETYRVIWDRDSDMLFRPYDHTLLVARRGSDNKWRVEDPDFQLEKSDADRAAQQFAEFAEKVRPVRLR